MVASIVVGLGFGDEGKGITTDYLASKSKHGIAVVRFSGGQQAGHTVVIGDKRHTYSTFGSGTGRGAVTYLSEYCTFYPPNALNEYKQLIDKGFQPSLSLHPLARLTTPWDVAWGRLRERIYNHGSCGIGVGATMTRTEQSPYKLSAVDLKEERILYQKLRAIGSYYRDKIKDFKLEEEMSNYYTLTGEAEFERFWDSLAHPFWKEVAKNCVVGYENLMMYSNLIFEGSQGILLDMEHGIFPNVTYAHTTSKNALAICNRLGIAQVDHYYVTRCYLTRHGKGWLPALISPIELINNENEHNVHNEWQGEFRVRELDYDLLKYAIDVDHIYSGIAEKHLVVTCLDQRPGFNFDYNKLGGTFDMTFHECYESWSPDSATFKAVY